MKIAVGFIAYNESSAKYLADFLPSLDAALRFLETKDYQVYVFDNSLPGRAENRLALEAFNHGLSSSGVIRKSIKYFSQGINLGFGRAYNILINEALREGAEYFLIINPDTILDKDAIKVLVNALDNDSNLGSVAPKILRWDFMNRVKTDCIDSLGLVLKPGLKFIDFGQGDKYDQKFDRAEIIGPSGAAGLFRLSALTQIAKNSQNGEIKQFFDEDFFMYKEDCDLAYRLFVAGFKSRFIPSAVIYHDRTAASVGQGLWQSIKARSKKSRQIRSWSFRNQHLIFVKHWKEQNIVNKIKIIFHCLAFFIFSLILEQFLLKEYPYILKSR